MPPLQSLRESLHDLSQPIGKRTHAAFYCRSIGSTDAADIISIALLNRNDSDLMRHEFAYILGQMQHSHVCPILIEILEDESDSILVRHESAEALGALGDHSSLHVLQKFCDHKSPEISETCQIAVDLIHWRISNPTSVSSGIYRSVDPAPAIVNQIPLPIEDLKIQLLESTKFSLFERYRAMFSLRDINTDESALALVMGFSDKSALFRHEVAYVLGQMQRKVTLTGLTEVLKNMEEHPMVRHEAAEAIGAIGGHDAEAILQDIKKIIGDDKLVGESCEVALDNIEYWSEF